MHKNYISTHYFLQDKSHAMNAFIANKCDKEILDAIIIVAEYLKISDSVKIEKLAKEEGGLIEWYQALSYANQVANLALLVAVVNCYFTVFPRKEKNHAEINTLKKRNLELDNESKELEIKKSRIELDKLLKEVNDDYSESSDQFLIQNDDRFDKLKEICLKAIKRNIELRRKQANFYKHLVNYNKVEAIGFTSYDKNFRQIVGERIINHQQFEKFLLDSDEDFEIIENAKIILISPILTKNRSKWKGYLVDQDIAIKFYMRDKEFKKDIDDRVINFKNGSTINAVLKIKTTYDEFGEEISKTYEVETVLKYTIDSKLIETMQGRNYKFNKEQLEKQQRFDF